VSIFRRQPRPARQWQGEHLPSPRAPLAVIAGQDKVVEPLLKDRPVRSEDYRRLVAALPCFLCGIEGFSQAAHADEGKGLGMKSSDLTCWPACGTRPGKTGCHFDVGTAGYMTRDERRTLEQNAAAHTRNILLALAYTDRATADVLRKVGLL